MGQLDRSRAVRALAALDDPSRQQLYDLVCAAKNGTTREAAADAIGISRKLAAFHLDRLVEAGLLVSTYDAAARTRQFGRPPKTYRRSEVDLRISIPERRPEALAHILVDALLAAESGEAPLVAARRLAYLDGKRLGAEARNGTRPGRVGPERALTIAETVLAAQGFEPARESSTCVRLRNCPYLPMSAHAPDLVCSMSQQHLAGLLDGIDAPTAVAAVLEPRAGECCVVLQAGTRVGSAWHRHHRPPGTQGRHPDGRDSRRL